MIKRIFKYQEGVFLTAVCLAAFLCAIGYSVIFKVTPVLDSKQFDTIGWNLAVGKGFVMENSEPTMSREPAYPYFLSFIYKIFGHKHGAVYAVQALIFSGIVLLSYNLAKYIFNEEVAKWSSLILAIFPTLGNYTIFLLSEVVFTFCLMALIFILSKSLENESYTGIFLSGVILAVLALTKAIMMYLIVFIIAGFFLYNFKDKYFIRKFLLKFAIILFAFTICISPWMFRNKHMFGTYAITVRGGKALYNRSIKLDYNWPRWKKILVFSISEFLGDKAYPGTVRQPSELLLVEDHMAEDRMAQLTKSGLSQAAADKVLFEESVEKIRSRPLLYLGQSFLESVKLLGFSHIPSLNEDSALEIFSKLRNGKILLAFTRGIFRVIAYPIILLCIAGISVSLTIWRKWLVMFIAILYVMTIYALTFSWGRYTVPLIPCYVIFMAAFIDTIVKKHRVKI